MHSEDLVSLDPVATRWDGTLMKEALEIHVKGTVQGVGFRPFVYRLAKRNLIDGWVLNAADGVHIHAEGESQNLDSFVLGISEEAPAASDVKEIDIKEVPLEPFDSFEIRFSDETQTDEKTLVSPDLATCPDCVRELFDPADRRYRYPFINCTNCGPRFTIIDDLPYDRAQTSMRDFPMCEECAAEYGNPEDRRFHAQPDACFACGPKVYLATPSKDGHDGSPGDRSECDSAQWEKAWGNNREESDAIFAKAVEMLLDGKILAVKGLGGFHLACNANDEAAVGRLRERKHRIGKAFAVMTQSLDDARALCHVGVAERAILEGSVRPIVLLRKRKRASIAKGIADGLPELGVMLPYTPVQHLLLHDFSNAWREEAHAGGEVPLLVMTSANIHDEPIIIDDEDAAARLAGIADAILGNDREILARFDDSVVRVISAGDSGEAMQMMRRARGFAPAPMDVSALTANKSGSSGKDSEGSAKRTIFATGPEQKNTFCFLRGSEAFVSQHIGDMEDVDVFDAWMDAKSRYQKLFSLEAEEIACDTHPEYITTKWAKEHCALSTPPLPLVEVQHHHAHIASVMAENGLADAVCGIAFDGTGYGADGDIWGGEVLMCNLSDFERFANFAYVPMPGGAACVKNPLQMAYGVLWEFDLLDHAGAKGLLDALGEDMAQTLETMIEQGINTPVTSSVGRLFDAASALLGICTSPTYEGEPAIMLEAALWDGVESGEIQLSDGGGEDGDKGSGAYRIEVVKNTATETSTAHDTSVLLFDAAPLFASLLDDLAAGVPISVISLRFHEAFANAILEASQLSRALYEISTIALSGGVFMNRYIIERSLAELEDAGFTVAINKELPPNDGNVSFGQAVCAASRE